MTTPTIWHRRIAYSMAHDELLSLYDDQGRGADKMQAWGSTSDVDDAGIMNALMEIIEKMDIGNRALYREAER